MRFTQEDLIQIKEKGIDERKVEEQLEIFRRGNLPVDIVAAATSGKGIHQFTGEDKLELEKYYEARKEQLDIVKFIPASGAATRMFKALHGFLADFDPQRSSVKEYIGQKNSGLKDFLNV